MTNPSSSDELILGPPLPRLNVMFWNLKQPRLDVLSSLVLHYAVDVLVLAECPSSPLAVLKTLNNDAIDYFMLASKCSKIMVFARFPDEFSAPLVEGEDYSIRRVQLPGRLEILLAMVHFPSKLFRTPLDQANYAADFSSQVLASAEKDHARTVLVGDLNMNPYEDGMVQHNALHAVMTKEIARRETRTVKFPSNRFFYNPMWRHFGEHAEGHAGTHYFASPKTRADYWNIYDQVLIRPELLRYFRDEELAIIHHAPGLNVSLLYKGKPDLEISDHLPLFFRLWI